MSLNRHPDPAIAAWLADGPATLTTSAVDDVKSTIRRTRQRSVVVLPLPELRLSPAWRLVLVAATLLSLVAGLVLVAGMVPDRTTDADPSASSPTATHAAEDRPPTPPPGQEPGTIRGAGRTIQLGWTFPDGLVYDDGPVYPSFEGAGQQGYFFTLDGQGQYDEQGIGPSATTRTPEARGIVVADVYGATVTFNNGVVLGDIDAATFMSRVGASARFLVGEVTSTGIAGTAALAADVRGAALERVPTMDFSRPSRLIAADIGGGIIAVQLWATTPERLQDWLREATPLLESFEFTERPINGCWDAQRPGTPVELDQLDRSGRFTLEGTNLTFDYAHPFVAFTHAESHAGVTGFVESPGGRNDEVATGLSYGYVGGDVVVARGLVVGEANGASRHTGGVTPAPPFGADPRSFFDGLQREPTVQVENVRDTDGPMGLVARSGVVTYAGSGWSHIDRAGTAPEGRGCLVDFTRPSRLSVVEVDGTLIAFQAWATGEAELARWIPLAQQIIETMTIVEGGP